MPLNNGKVAIPVNFFRTLIAAGYSAQSLRFLTALYHHSDVTGITPTSFGREQPDGYQWVEVPLLRKNAGFAGDNGNRAIVKFEMVMRETGGRVFEQLAIGDDGKTLFWRFSQSAWDAFSDLKYDQDDWALVTLSDIAKMRTAFQFLLYLEFQNFRNGKAPFVRLSIPQGFERASRWFDSVGKICAILKCRCFVGFERDVRDYNNRTALIRIVREDTTWHPNALRKWAPSAEVYYVDATHGRRIAPTSAKFYEGPGIDPDWKPRNE